MAHPANSQKLKVVGVQGSCWHRQEMKPEGWHPAARGSLHPALEPDSLLAEQGALGIRWDLRPPEGSGGGRVVLGVVAVRALVGGGWWEVQMAGHGDRYLEVGYDRCGV